MDRSCVTDPQKLDQKSNDWEVGIFMAKYSFEFKKKVVMEYLSGKRSQTYLVKKYDIGCKAQLQRWIGCISNVWGRRVTTLFASKRTILF